MTLEDLLDKGIGRGLWISAWSVVYLVVAHTVRTGVERLMGKYLWR